MYSNSFNYKVALITGSSQGIGKAIAIELLKKGAAVVINGQNAEKLLKTEAELKTYGKRVFAVSGDISNPQNARFIIEEAVDHFGRLDIVINNAGISMKGNLAKQEPSAFEKVFKVNVLGSINICRYALTHIRESQGSIVFISSVAGIRGLPGFSAYSASKMALRAVAESLRIEEAQSNIHVGLMYVGFTENELKKQSLTADGSWETIKVRKDFKLQSREEVAQAVLKNISERKFISTLSPLGKLNMIMQRIAPRLVEKILIRASQKTEALALGR